MTTRTVTWDDLAALEPRLVYLDAAARAVDTYGCPQFCANAVWYGDGGFKAALGEVVGWSRNQSDVNPHVYRKWDQPKHMRWLSSVDDLHEMTAWAGSVEATLRGADEAAGHGVLWTTDAYDVAYGHLYRLLPDCRECGCF